MTSQYVPDPNGFIDDETKYYGGPANRSAYTRTARLDYADGIVSGLSTAVREAQTAADEAAVEKMRKAQAAAASGEAYADSDDDDGVGDEDEDDADERDGSTGPSADSIDSYHGALYRATTPATFDQDLALRALRKFSKVSAAQISRMRDPMQAVKSCRSNPDPAIAAKAGEGYGAWKSILDKRKKRGSDAVERLKKRAKSEQALVAFQSNVGQSALKDAGIKLSGGGGSRGRGSFNGSAFGQGQRDSSKVSISQRAIH